MNTEKKKTVFSKCLKCINIKEREEVFKLNTVLTVRQRYLCSEFVEKNIYKETTVRKVMYVVFRRY